MAEGGQGTAILAEGNDIELTAEGGDVNVVAGNQIRGDQFNAIANNGRDQVPGPSGSAVLADGNVVNQKITNCDVNVVGGDQIQGDVHNYYTMQVTNGVTQVVNLSAQEHPGDGSRSGHRAYREPVAGANRSEPHPQSVTENVPTTSTNMSLMTKFKEKVTGTYTEGFINKLNAYSWKNIQGGVVDNYEDLTDPGKDFYPQMKTGFQLFKGDYVPQDGFSAHCQPKKGKYMDFYECLDIIQDPNDKPVMIIGQPGSGKTVFMKRLAKALLISNGLQKQEDTGIYRRAQAMFRRKKKTAGFDVVLHMNVRDIQVIDGNLSDVIFNNQVLGITPKEARYGLEGILKNKIKIVMVFDGLDQATWEPDCSRKLGPLETASTANIFGNILSGHLLSHVPIVVSSREHSVACLPQEMRPQVISALVGFSEHDAKSLYCLIMGEGADEDWDQMRESNPAMHYMCLTPLFLIFYMITRKHNPENPPDCATAVMISILQIFLESENSRRVGKKVDVSSLLQKLKRMAYQGTKEQRVVFEKEDLEKFKLLYKDISDIVIQVPGFSILGQRILDGMYRFFFSHQTLQEILSALHVVGSKYDEFKDVVDKEFSKPYWSVIQSFVCGILRNEPVRNRIPKFLLNPSDSKQKWEYLVEHLKRRLSSTISRADRLEIFVALKEANAFHLVRRFAEDLDFSNSPLTPAMINTLCSVMKNICEVRRLSLAHSGMDSELLEVLAKGADGLGITVATMDMRGNTTCKDVQIWRRIFENLAITDCFMEIPNNKESEADTDYLLKLVDAARGKVDKLYCGELQKVHWDTEQLLKIAESGVEMKITKLDIRRNTACEDVQTWVKILGNLGIGDCFMTIPNNEQTESNVEYMMKIIDAARDKVDKLHFGELQKIYLDIGHLAKLAESSVEMKIGEVNLIEQSLSNADWKRFGKIANEFQVTKVTHGARNSLFSDLPDLQSFADGHRNVKIKRIIIWWYTDYSLELYLSQSNSESVAFEKLKSLKVVMDRRYVEKRPREVGGFIRESSFEEVVIFNLYSNVDVSSFASGLSGFKIKHLAVASFNKTSIVSIVRGCKVENLYICQDYDSVLEKLERHTKVTILSEDEWNQGYLYT